MAQTKQHAKKGGNAGVYDTLVKQGVSPAKAKRAAKIFRSHTKKGG